MQADVTSIGGTVPDNAISQPLLARPATTRGLSSRPWQISSNGMVAHPSRRQHPLKFPLDTFRTCEAIELKIRQAEVDVVQQRQHLQQYGLRWLPSRPRRPPVEPQRNPHQPHAFKRSCTRSLLSMVANTERSRGFWRFNTARTASSVVIVGIALLLLPFIRQDCQLGDVDTSTGVVRKLCSTSYDGPRWKRCYETLCKHVRLFWFSLSQDSFRALNWWK